MYETAAEIRHQHSATSSIELRNHLATDPCMDRTKKSDMAEGFNINGSGQSQKLKKYETMPWLEEQELISLLCPSNPFTLISSFVRHNLDN